MLRSTTTGTSVPLKSVYCHVDIKERIASLTYEQHFLNEEKQQIEAVYIFPTPAESSIFSFEAKTDEGKVIVALCKEKIQAKKEYNQAINEGNTAYYADHDDTKAFRVCIGNLGPLSGAQITIKIVCELDNEEDHKKVRLNIPTTLSEKYTPSYMYSSSFNSRTVNPSKTEKKPYNMSIIGNIQMGSRLVSVESKTHKIKLSNMEKHSAHFEITDLEELNRDVVLTIERETSATTAFTQDLPSISTSTLKNPVLKYCTAVNLVPDFSRLPKVNINDCEYVLCLDVSGSMKGKRIETCKEAAQHFVTTIPIEASFRIYTFQTCFEEFKCTETNILARKQAASEWIDKIRAEGGTELLPVLKDIYSTVDKRKNTVIIVLSDGDISNNADVFRLVKANSNATMFSLGIGNNVSQDLIRGLAINGGGQARFVGEGDKSIIKTVRELMKLAQDTLRKHQNDYKVVVNTIGGRSRNVPSVSAPLYENVDNTLYVFSEYEPASVTFTTYDGEDPNNRTENPMTLYPVKIDDSEATLHRIAGIKLINELVSQEKSLADKPKGSRLSDMRVETEPDSTLKNEIIDVSTDLNVLSSYTAFIGVEVRENKLTGDMELREVPLQQPMREYDSRGMKEGCFMQSAALCSSYAMPRSVSVMAASMAFQPESAFEIEESACVSKGLLGRSSNKSFSTTNSRSMSKSSKSVSNNNKKRMDYFDDSSSGDNDIIKPGASGPSEDTGFMTSVLNYFNTSTSNSSSSTNTSSANASSAKPLSTGQYKPKPTVVLVVDKALNGLSTKGLLSGKKNGSLLEMLIKLLGASVVTPLKLAAGSIIQLTGESFASHNGFYEIVEIGSDDQPWVLQCVY